jgi:hypothetical protein
VINKVWRSGLSAWIVIALIAGVYVAFTLYMHENDPMVFVQAGSLYDSSVPGNTIGYDGQFYYFIAKDPLHAWSTLDIPVYRYRRIIYPALGYLLSLGNDRLLPWILIFINYLAIVGTTFMLEKSLTRQGLSRWYALPYGLFIGSLMSLRLDLTEPLAFFFYQAGLLAWIDNRKKISGSLFALAILSKEIVLPLVFGFWLFRLIKREKKIFIWGVSVVAPFLTWLVLLRIFFDNWGIGSGGAYSTGFEWIPYFGWWKTALYQPDLFPLLSIVVVPLTVIPSLLCIVFCVYRIWRREFSLHLFGLFFYALIYPILPTSIILDPLGSVRLTSGLIIALINYGAETRNMRILKYNFLWIITSVFIYKDSLLPVGHTRIE